MVSTLKQRLNGSYYCSNCMMLQPIPPKENCPFCGNWFSNYENIVIYNSTESLQAQQDRELANRTMSLAAEREIELNESYF